jgi:hypothetical protein
MAKVIFHRDRKRPYRKWPTWQLEIASSIGYKDSQELELELILRHKQQLEKEKRKLDKRAAKILDGKW